MLTKIIEPRFGDTDGLRHINNTVVPSWFEEARNPLYRIFMPDLTFEKWRLILAHVETDFLSEMRYGRDVEIRSWVERVGTTSFTVHQEAWQNGARRACGKTVVVHYDFEACKSIPIPDDLRARLSEHLLESPPDR